MYRMITADAELEPDDYIRYIPPRGPKTDSDLDFVAETIARYVKQSGRSDRESVIERFRSMNEDYDDWWARGLRTHEQEQEFLDDIASRCKEDYGVRIEVQTYLLYQ